ncbi:hypothetical protein ZIOFF_028329 [Zingiber officinale]|uniref:Autophagy-related protein 101 n=1 Tax=Zingiber officinale TaxID=94328 RepID=A0A8J5GZJ9_ZINOF|nr:hypothetical protein ZIOFF_028329 [Zingiber officinale]
MDNNHVALVRRLEPRHRQATIGLAMADSGSNLCWLEQGLWVMVYNKIRAEQHFANSTEVGGLGSAMVLRSSSGLLQWRVQCGDHELDKKIEEKTDQLIAWVEKHPNKKSQVSFVASCACQLQYACLSMKSKTSMLHGLETELSAFIGSSENTSEEGSSRRTALESSLREVLFQIIRFVNEKKDHIPPVQNSEIISFPYEISTPSASDSSFGWHADVLKRMLQTGHPSMLS